jgi:hypothetical protein
VRVLNGVCNVMGLVLGLVIHVCNVMGLVMGLAMGLVISHGFSVEHAER